MSVCTVVGKIRSGEVRDRVTGNDELTTGWCILRAVGQSQLGRGCR